MKTPILHKILLGALTLLVLLSFWHFAGASDREDLVVPWFKVLGPLETSGPTGIGLSVWNYTGSTIYTTANVGFGTIPDYPIHSKSGTLRHEGQNILLGTTAAGDNDASIIFCTDSDSTSRYLKWDDGNTGFYCNGNIAAAGLFQCNSSFAKYLMQNTSSEDTNEGRETYLDFRGQSLTPSVVAVSNAQIYGGKDGSGTDHNGKLWIMINDGDDGQSPTLRTLEINYTGLIAFKKESGITASTTQSQGQQPLVSNINEVATVGNANDVVTMPACHATMSYEIKIINNGANTLQIYPATGDDLGAGVNTSVTLASGSNVTFVNYDDTNWEQF